MDHGWVVEHTACGKDNLGYGSQMGPAEGMLPLSTIVVAGFVFDFHMASTLPAQFISTVYGWSVRWREGRFPLLLVSIPAVFVGRVVLAEPI